MARKDEFVVRFGVGEPASDRSSVWRVWVPKGSNDVYIAARTLGGTLKVSLHVSGRWRTAFTSESASRGVPWLQPGTDRALEKWNRPAEFVPGVTRAFVVTIPSSEV